FYKRTEICHTCNGTFYYVANRILLIRCKPRIGILKLHAESNLGILDLLDQDFHFISDFKQFLRMFYASPGHLGNMKQSVRSSQIDKCAEVRHILHCSFYHITFMDTCEQLFLHLCFLGNQKLSAVSDNPSSLRIKLGDDELNLLIRIFSKILFIRIG